MLLRKLHRKNHPKNLKLRLKALMLDAGTQFFVSSMVDYWVKHHKYKVQRMRTRSWARFPCLLIGERTFRVSLSRQKLEHKECNRFKLGKTSCRIEGFIVFTLALIVLRMVTNLSDHRCQHRSRDVMFLWHVKEGETSFWNIEERCGESAPYENFQIPAKNAIFRFDDSTCSQRRLISQRRFDHSYHHSLAHLDNPFLGRCIFILYGVVCRRGRALSMDWGIWGQQRRVNLV